MNASSIIRIFIILLAISVIAGYAYYRSKDFARGPVVSITSPENGSTITKLPLEIVGRARGVSYISINDRPIFTDEQGDFRDTLLLYTGYNIISIKARDRFYRSTEETLALIYKPPAQATTSAEAIAPAKTGTSTSQETKIDALNLNALQN